MKLKNKNHSVEISALISYVDDLMKLLEAESNALKVGDIEGVVSLLEEKQRLILKINGLKDQEEALKDSSAAELRQKLTDLFNNLEKNQQALENMISAVRGITAQVEFINEKKKDNGLYGRRGKKMTNLNDEKIELNGEI